MSLFQFGSRLFFAVSLASLVAASATGCAVQQDVGTSRQADGGTESNNPGNDGDASPNGAKRFFVTAATFEGDFEGKAGADEKCALAAEGASLTGTWKALLATLSKEDTREQFEDVGPWYLVDGTKIFNNRAQMIAGLPFKPPCITEQGTNLCLASGSVRVWTGAMLTCQDWTDIVEIGSYGLAKSKDDWWQVHHNSADEPAALNCINELHLYCIEQ